MGAGAAAKFDYLIGSRLREESRQINAHFPQAGKVGTAACVSPLLQLRPQGGVHLPLPPGKFLLRLASAEIGLLTLAREFEVVPHFGCLLSASSRRAVELALQLVVLQ